MKWISEGFVYAEKEETSLYKLGDSYFSELVNRSMVQPIDIDYEDKVISCRVHDMVLDLICSLASEENFVTVLDGTKRKMYNSQSKVRRLSVQNSKVDVATGGMAEVRSLTVLGGNVGDRELSISSFKVLRGLHLVGCGISDVEHVGNLLHLRYLGLNDWSVKMLPMELGNLQFLQTLDIRGSNVEALPPSVIRLRRLKCLYVDGDNEMELPPGIGNLTCLEVLEELRLAANSNLHFVEDLGHLTKLWILQFSFASLDESMCKTLVKSLKNLHKLEILRIRSVTEPCGGDLEFMREGWVPPQQLLKLNLWSYPYSVQTLPVWVNPSSLHVLSSLDIVLNEMRPEDIQILGMLPALRHLRLDCRDTSDSVRDEMRMFIVTPDSFPCARECYIYGIPILLSTFPRGAAPRLKILYFSFPAEWACLGDLDLGMAHLPSLESLRVSLWGKSEAIDAEVSCQGCAKGRSGGPSQQPQNHDCLTGLTTEKVEAAGVLGGYITSSTQVVYRSTATLHSWSRLKHVEHRDLFT